MIYTTTDEQFEAYKAELREVFNRDNLEEIRAFAVKWGFPIPDHPVAFEAGVRKLQFNEPGIRKSLKKRARVWLLNNGFTTEG